MSGEMKEGEPRHCQQWSMAMGPVVVCEREDLRAKIDELQGLIDDYADASRHIAFVGASGPRLRAHLALLAAASTEALHA